MRGFKFMFELDLETPLIFIPIIFSKSHRTEKIQLKNAETILIDLQARIINYKLEVLFWPKKLRDIWVQGSNDYSTDGWALNSKTLKRF